MKKRNEIEIAHDRAKVCELLNKGYRSRTEIASIINEGRPVNKHISDQQIRNDIEYMSNLYMEKGLEDFNYYRNQLEDEIQLLKRTFYKGYEMSRRNKITLESEAVVIEDEENYEHLLENGLEDSNDSEEKSFQRVGKLREERRLEGNPAFLQGVQGCIDRLMKLYGVEAPSKMSLDVKGSLEVTDVALLMKEKM